MQSILKPLFLFFILIAQSIHVYAQEADTLYYKDTKRKKESTKESAKYFEIHAKNDEGEVLKSLYKISSSDAVMHRAYSNDSLISIWTESPEDFLELGNNFEVPYSKKKKTNEGDSLNPDSPDVEMAEFIGGHNGFAKYLSSMLEYPETSRRYGIEGRVYVQFIITKAGKIESVAVAQGVEESLDREAARVIILSPDWSPTLENGIPVETKMVMAIEFKRS